MQTGLRLLVALAPKGLPMAWQFEELTEFALEPLHVGDINNLLHQLSPNLPKCNIDSLSYLLTSVRIFVALEDTTIVGMVSLVSLPTLSGQKDWIEDLVVIERLQRKGIATKLMDMAEQASRESGARSINLTSSTGRSAARNFYAKRGYVLRETGVFRLTF